MIGPVRIAVGPGDDVAALVRGAASGSIVLVVAPLTDPLELALARAAIGPLAVERATGTRVNAVFVGEGAAAADIEAAVTFLESARSTTGQVLDVA